MLRTAELQIDVRRTLLAYYVATALFVALDAGFSINVRVAFLEGLPAWRAAYYGFLLICLAMVLWRPTLSAVVGTVESTLTLSALIINMALRAMPATQGMVGEGFVTLPEVINFMMSGSMAYLAWARGMRQLFGTDKRWHL